MINSLNNHDSDNIFEYIVTIKQCLEINKLRGYGKKFDDIFDKFKARKSGVWKKIADKIIPEKLKNGDSFDVNLHKAFKGITWEDINGIFTVKNNNLSLLLHNLDFLNIVVNDEEAYVKYKLEDIKNVQNIINEFKGKTIIKEKLETPHERRKYISMINKIYLLCHWIKYSKKKSDNSYDKAEIKSSDELKEYFKIKFEINNEGTKSENKGVLNKLKKIFKETKALLTVETIVDLIELNKTTK